MLSSLSSPQSIPGHAPSNAMPRDQLLAIGRAGRAWDFLFPAFGELARTPEDHGLRLLAITSSARLGLRSAALEHLEALPDAVRSAPELKSLIVGIHGLADDRIGTPELLRTLEVNRQALGDRLLLDSPDVPITLPDEIECFRANDGNIARRVRGQWIAIHDEWALARKSLREHTSAWATDATQTLVLEGVYPPWLFKLALEARPREALGYLAPIQIVQQNPEDFAIGLSLVDLSEHLGRGHVHAFVGEESSRRFADFLKSRVDRRLLGTIALTPGTRPAVLPSVTRCLEDAILHQDHETRRLENEVHAMYAPRNRAWWAGRFAQALPKRVLLLTSRFSTFVKHSTQDLADALIALGHEARVIIQPDDFCSLSACAYLRAVRDFDPDLVVVLNYPRATIGEFMPRNLPWVCWIQDQMPHLFDERIGKGLGDLDFTVGHILNELHTKYAYPRASSMLLPVPASETKFFASPASDADRATFECEVAYVSHQSETPEVQHDRILSELRSNPTVDAALVRALPILRDAVASHVKLPLSTLPFPSMNQVVCETLANSLGIQPPDHIVNLLVTGYAYPLADRTMRHETLEWAANAARKRGWRFNLYGNGWQNHPTLGEFAKGPLGHESDLRRSYQLAGCHLQVTYHMLAHPRLCECVLSGGIPLCRFHWIERSMIETWLFKLGWHQGAEFRDTGIGADVRRSAWTDAPALLRFASVFQSLGCFEDAIAPDPIGDFEGLEPGALRDLRWGAPFHPRLVTDRLMPAELSHPFAFQMVGEQPELFFHNAATLESRIAEIAENPHLREIRNGVARRRIAQKHTYRSAAERIITFVQTCLGATDKAVPSAA